jgi:hypothetical protein
MVPNEDQGVWGPMDGHSLVWWVINNVVWTDSWPSIAGASCIFICIGACEEQERKVLALRGVDGPYDKGSTVKTSCSRGV